MLDVHYGSCILNEHWCILMWHRCDTDAKQEVDLLKFGAEWWRLPGGIILLLRAKCIAQVVPGWPEVHHTASPITAKLRTLHRSLLIKVP